MKHAPDCDCERAGLFMIVRGSGCNAYAFEAEETARMEAEAEAATLRARHEALLDALPGDPAAWPCEVAHPGEGTYECRHDRLCRVCRARVVAQAHAGPVVHLAPGQVAVAWGDFDPGDNGRLPSIDGRAVTTRRSYALWVRGYRFPLGSWEWRVSEKDPVFEFRDGLAPDLAAAVAAAVAAVVAWARGEDPTT